MVNNMIADEKLLLRNLRAGDQRAFEDIFNHFWTPLYHYLAKTISDHDDIEDILQGLFLSLWNRRKEVVIDNLGAFLFGSARRAAFYHLRRSAANSRLIAALATFIEEKHNHAEAAQAARELEDFINKQIEALPPRMKEVFILSRKEQLTYKQIADRLDISDQTVKKQMQHVLRIFRNNIDKHQLLLLSVLLSLPIPKK